MAFPSFLRRLFAASLQKEDSYRGKLAEGKNVLNAIIFMKQLYYNITSTMVSSYIAANSRCMENQLWRLVMDSLQQFESPHKPCKTCQHIFPATAMYFYHDKYSKDGLCSSCKECMKAARRKYYVQNAEKAIVYSKQYMADNREHTAQYQKRYAEQHKAELTAYKKAHYAEHQEENKVRSRQWYAEHKQYASDYWKQIRKQNPEKKREQDRRYRQEHIAEKRERDRKYKEDHKAERILQSKQYYIEHKEEICTYNKQYYQTERGIIAKRASAHNRRARRKKASGSHTAKQLYEQFKKQGGKCFYCQQNLQHARNSWHADQSSR